MGVKITTSGGGGTTSLPNGSKTAPSLAFASESNLGLFRYTANSLAVANGGNVSYDFTNIPGKGLRIGAAWGMSFGGSVLDSADTSVGLNYAAAGVLKITDSSSGGGSLQFQEVTAPTAPAADNCILFAQDNGAGKTRLVVRFNSGADVVLATQA